MRKGSTITLYAAAILLCAAGVGLSVVGDAMDGRLPGNPRPGATGGFNATHAPRASSAGADRNIPVFSESSALAGDTMICWVTRYTTCGHEKARMEAPEPQFVGKTATEFAAYYPDCKLEIESGQIRMVRSIDQYCPDHYYIKSDDSGNIYVYRNMEGLDKLTMVMKLNFTIAAVPADFQPLLNEGMAFGSVEEIEGLIEDADS